MAPNIILLVFLWQNKISMNLWHDCAKLFFFFVNLKIELILYSNAICYDLSYLSSFPGASDIVQKCGYQPLKFWSSVYSFSPVMLTQWELQTMLVGEWHQVRNMIIWRWTKFNLWASWLYSILIAMHDSNFKTL